MFLIPIGTDAPVYHFPWGTIGLIAINVLVLAAGTAGLLPPVEELAPQFGLVHGAGLLPWQWVTSNFLHAGWPHLLGNMVYLWPFGLIVEGKLGWRRFLAVYLGIGVAECLLEQVCLAGPGLTLGASSIIFGLMAIAAVWAPRNDIEVAYGIWAPFFARVDTFDLPVMWLCGLLFATEGAIAAWLNFPIGSELFHLVGAALGAGVGFSLLRAGQVDCEGWDVLSLRRRRRREQPVLRTNPSILDGRSAELEALPPDVAQQKQTQRKMRALTRIHQRLSAGDAPGAWSELQRTQQVLSDFQLGPRDAVRLAQALVDAQAWTEAVAAYEGVISRFPAEADAARLIAAEILIHRQRRPAAALKHLRALDVQSLTKEQSRQFAALQKEAETLVDSGVVELEGQAWGSV